MESTASLRLPLQSPPVFRGRAGHHGHQHPGGIETAECEGTSGPGTCIFDSGIPSLANVTCTYCCNVGNPQFSRFWVPNDEDGMPGICEVPAQDDYYPFSIGIGAPQSRLPVQPDTEGERQWNP